MTMRSHPHSDHPHESHRGLISTRPDAPLFEAYVRQRVAELEATATTLPARDGASVGAVARLRRSVGHALIAVGATVAGGEARERVDAHRTTLAA
jgi:hypothetical protein